MDRSALRSVLALALAGFSLAAFEAPGKAQVQGPASGGPRFVRAASAAQSISPQHLRALAAASGRTPAQMQAVMARGDRDLWMTRRGALAYACNGMVAPHAAQRARAATPAPPFPLADTFKLHSRPASTKKIYLDFDGHTTSNTWWNDEIQVPNIVSPPFDQDGTPGTFSDAEREEIQLIWQQVMEDFAPFDVDVTTEDPGVDGLRRLNQSDNAYGTRVVISPNEEPAPGAGGVAYLGVFDDVFTGPDLPCFAFSENLGPNHGPYIAECISHEVGHTVGLDHDGFDHGNGTIDDYYSGDPGGNWAPIMGTGYDRDIVQFSQGEYSGANNKEDDLAIIPQNGCLYRADDYGNTMAKAKTLVGQDPTITGVIETRTDVDVFRFNTGLGNNTIKMTAAPLAGNLDIRVNIFDSAGNNLAFSDPPGLAATMTRQLPAGAYYLVVDGAGFGSAATTGYSDYGSIGQYAMSVDLVGSGGAMTVEKPNGGEVLLKGEPTTIEWESVGLGAAHHVKIELLKPGGQVELLDADETEVAGQGSFNWTPPFSLDSGDGYSIRITSLTDPTSFDLSDTPFRVEEGSIEVDTPNGGDVFRTGNTVAIEWTGHDYITQATAPFVKIELSRDGGLDGTWETLFTSTPNDGQQNWQVTGPETEDAVIRVSTQLGSSTFGDESDAPFEIRLPSKITVDKPAASHKVGAPDQLQIAWTGQGFKGGVKVELSRSGGANGTWETLFPNGVKSGAVNWNVSGPATKLCRIRVTSLEEPDVHDVSSGFFEITAPTINVTAPTGSSKTVSSVGRTAIRWNSTGLPAGGKVKVELSVDGGSTFLNTPVADNVDNNGVLDAVLNTSSPNAVLRVTSKSNPSVFGLSGTFNIQQPTLFLVTPNGGNNLRLGNQEVIQWSGTIVGRGRVHLDISRNGGPWKPLVVDVRGQQVPVDNDGAHSIGLSGGTAKKAKIRVSWLPEPGVTGPSLVDESDGFFQISAKKKK